MSKFMGGDHETSVIGPGVDAKWLRIAVVTTKQGLKAVLEALEPLIMKRTVLLANAQKTPEGNRPVILLHAADDDAFRKVTKAIGGMAKVKRVS